MRLLLNISWSFTIHRYSRVNYLRGKNNYPSWPAEADGEFNNFLKGREVKKSFFFLILFLSSFCFAIDANCVAHWSLDEANDTNIVTGWKNVDVTATWNYNSVSDANKHFRLTCKTAGTVGNSYTCALTVSNTIAASAPKVYVNGYNIIIYFKVYTYTAPQIKTAWDACSVAAGIADCNVFNPFATGKLISTASSTAFSGGMDIPSLVAYLHGTDSNTWSHAATGEIGAPAACSPIKRESVAIQGDGIKIPFTDVTTGVGRTVPMAVTSVVDAPILGTANYIPVVVDTEANCVLAVNGTKVYKSNNPTLTGWDTVVDVCTTEPMATFYAAGNDTIFVALCNGEYLLWLGQSDVSPDGETSYCKVFRSTGKTAPWTLVQNCKYTAPAINASIDVCGKYVVWGNYTSVTEGIDRYYVNDRNVYFSDNNGVSFVKIAGDLTWESAGVGTGRHIHSVTLDKDNPSQYVWVSYGDGHSAGGKKERQVIRLARPAGWTTATATAEGDDVGDWTVKKFSESIETIGGFTIGGKYYCGGESGCSRIWRFDPDSNSCRAVFTMPFKNENKIWANVDGNERYGPYYEGSILDVIYDGTQKLSIGNLEWINGAGYATGVIWGTNINADPNLRPQVGLYATVDGDNWTCVYSNPLILGFRQIVGVWNNKLVFTYQADGAGLLAATIPQPDIATRTAIFIEKGYANKAHSTDANASTFDGGVDNDLASISAYGIYPTSPLQTSMIFPTGGLYASGGEYLRLDPNNAYTDWIRMYMPRWSTASVVPAAGTFATVIAKMRDNVPNTQNLCEWDNDLLTYDATNLTNIRYCYQAYQTSDWFNFFGTYYFFGTTASAAEWEFLFSRAFGVYYDTNNITFDIDAFNVIYDTDRWRGRDTTFYPSDGTTEADEYAIIPIESLTDSTFSITFDWCPMNGSRAFASKIPVCGITGTGGSYINLLWDVNSSLVVGEPIDFKLTDGTNSVSTTYHPRWMHYDDIKVAITSDGTNSNLYIFDPVNGIKKTTCTGVNLIRPTNLILGNNAQKSLTGTGCYTNVRVYDSVLSATDVNTAFNTITPADTLFADAAPASGALSFNGSTDYIDTRSDFNTVFKDDFSVSLWFKKSEITGNDYVFSLYSGEETGIALYLRENHSMAFDYTIEEIDTSGETGGTFNIDEWTMITITVERTGLNLSAALYKNGILIKSGENLGGVYEGSGLSLYIGCLNDGSPSNYFSGSLDDIRIYNKALTQEQIIVIYNDAGLPDNTAPTPDPIVWAIEPNAASRSSITMKAKTAADTSGAEYYFANITDSNHDSNWVASSSWTDTGLDSNTTYTYQVKARDMSANHNETGWSDAAIATTLIWDCTAPIVSDLDGDCQVDLFDYVILSNVWTGDWLDILRFAEDWLTCNRDPAKECWQ